MRSPNQKRIPIARKLRRDSTSAESKLWAELRNRQLGGFKFVRQVPIGKYIADFVCREAQLVVEVDGATHSTNAEVTRDESRTSFLKGLGYRVVRIQNDDVYNAMEGGCGRLEKLCSHPECDEEAPHPPIAAQWVPPSPR